jgi:hypothetical protein
LAEIPHFRRLARLIALSVIDRLKAQAEKCYDALCDEQFLFEVFVGFVFCPLFV